jgi:fructose-1-phosphate kinase PfkB-like protein
MTLSQPVATLTLNPSADISVEVDRWRPGEKLRAKVVR